MATPAATLKKFHVRWNNYTPVLQAVFRKLLIEEKFVDVTLACEGKSIKCHRVVLAACSPYFEKVLSENTSCHLVIFLQNTKIWELQALVTYMYNGEVSANQQKLTGLVRTAEALKVKGLAPETLEEPIKEEAEEEVVDFKTMINFLGEPELPEESLLKITQIPATPPPSPPKVVLPAPPTLIQCPTLPPPGKSVLKRKGQGMPALPKLVKMQKVENCPPPLPKLVSQPQPNGNVGRVQIPRRPPTLTAEREPTTSRTSKPTTRTPTPPQRLAATTIKKEVVSPVIIDEDDTELHDFERAETDELYGDGDDFDAIVEEDDFKDVEDDMEMIEEGEIEEYADVNSVEGQSSESDNEDAPPGSVAAKGGRKLRYKYTKDIRDSAIGALNSGVSLRQCSEAFGIPRKTLSKWKAQEARDTLTDETGEIDDSIVRKPPGIDAAERAQRLNQAMALAMTGTTVRQAAAHFDIPRTTLCAFMKRRGVAPKRNFLPTPGGIPGLPLPKRSTKQSGETTASTSRPSSASTSNSSLPVMSDDYHAGMLDLIEDMNGE